MIRLAGHAPESRTFDTRAEAKAWAELREEDLRLGRLSSRSATLGEAMRRYARDVSPTKRGARWERLRLNALLSWDRTRKTIASLTPNDVAAWRDARLREVSPATVAREMNLLRSVLEMARKEWGLIRDNPMNDVRRPTQPPARRRRVSQDEAERLCAALGYVWPTKPANASQRVALAFLFALETAMRSGEIVGLVPADVHLRERYVNLPRTKNGDARQVPLSPQAVKILQLLRDSVPVFGLTSAIRDALFRKARKRAWLEDLHFHDARAEAIWRLSKKLDVLQLARAVGHRDIRSLMLYYAESATDLAKRLA